MNQPPPRLGLFGQPVGGSEPATPEPPIIREALIAHLATGSRHTTLVVKPGSVTCLEHLWTAMDFHGRRVQWPSSSMLCIQEATLEWEQGEWSMNDQKPQNPPPTNEEKEQTK